jgi:hypothetical protein
MAVDKYKQETDPKTKVQSAKTIADTFIKDGSSLEVNIDGFTKSAFLKNLDQISPEYDNLDTLFDATYKLVFLELKSDSFVRYLDSETFKDFAKKKGHKFMNELCPQEAVKQLEIKWSPFDVNWCIQNDDVVTLLRMVEDLSNWTPLQVTKKFDREKDYYSYINRTRIPLDPSVPDQMGAKFVGVLPVSAEQALYVLIDREYRPKWEPFVKYQTELPMHKEGDYSQTVAYAEMKLMFFLKTRFCCGNTSILYDSERRCYLLISKTTTGVDHKPLMRKKSAISSIHMSVYVIYKITDSKCRYVAMNHSFLNMSYDISDGLFKTMMRKRGKFLFEYWLQLSKERVEKYGNEKPRFCPELDTLDDFKQKYLPNLDSVKTWIL